MKQHTLLQQIARAEQELEQLLFDQKKAEPGPWKDGFNEFIHRKRKQLKQLREGV